MAIVIKFDVANNPLPARLILATKSGSRIRELPIEDVTFRDGLMDGSEFTCVVNKRRCVNTSGEVDEGFWRRIVDFKLAYCPEYDQWYEIYVNINDSTDTKKSIQARSLGEAELSQINVYGVDVNNEDDISRIDYEPTVLYNSSDAKTSLVDRLLNKAPHYRIKHVDDSIANIQRTFSFDNKSIYDCFQEISTEVGCIFILEANKTNEVKVDRTVSVYDLENSCMVCGTRGDFTEECPECGSTAIKPGYGDDTTIFVAKENLADEISYDTDSDSVKNCFRLEAGDDLMTASIINCNPNGSQYIWYITDEMKDDMSDELSAKIDDYDALYDYYQNEYEFTPNENLVTQYNQIVAKYLAFKPELNTISSPITGFANVMTAYYDTIDLQLFLNSELMPTVAIETTTAALEAAKLYSSALTPTAVANLSSCTESIASTAVLGVAKCLVRGNYQVKVNDSSYDSVNHMWEGNFTVTNYADEEDTATSATAQVFINEDIEDYINQKLRKAMYQKSDDVTDISDLFGLSLSNFKTEIRKYSLQRLFSFRDACQVAMDILIQQGVADSTNWTETMRDLYDDVYLPYRNKMTAIEDEILLRTQEIAVVTGIYDENGGLLVEGVQSDLLSARKAVQQSLNFEEFLGEELWNEFASFRREDTFSNSNYISDGLNNEEIFARAEEFIRVAKKEIYKSATLQHSISASMLNLLSTIEFRPLVHNFKVGNWIRVKIDGRIYRLRLVEYTIDYDTWDLNVTFSDVKQGHSSANDLESLISSMRSMSTSYGAVARQARAGKDGNDLLNHWAAEGFSLTTKIVGGAENQEFIIDQSGITGREYVPETYGYKDTQIKIISDGLYVTDDGWLTAKAGIGKFQFYNPQTEQIEEAYGVIADTIVGSIVLSEEVGIYNEGGNITLDENGFTLIADASNNGTVFRIRKRLGNGTLVDILNLDSNGNLVLQSYSTTADIESTYLSKEDAAQEYAEKSNTITDVYVEYIVTNSPTTPPAEDAVGWSTDTPTWTEGSYIWQRTTTINGNGSENHSDPSCIQGAAGEDGVGIDHIDEYYAVSSSNSQEPADSAFSTSIPTMDATNKYLWNYEVVTYTDTSSEPTNKRVIGVFGEDGATGSNGRNTAIVYLYQRAGTQPSVDWNNSLTYSFTDKELTSDAPSGWRKTIYAGSDPLYVTAATASSENSTVSIAPNEWSTPVMLVQNGTNGRGVSQTQIRYASSDNGQTAPSSGWGPSVPNVAQGNYLWTRTVITYTDTTTSTSYSVAYVGTDGEDGNSVAVTSATKNNGITTVVLTDTDGQTTTLTINDGEDGSSGTPGANGYVHTAWANSANGATDFSTTVSTNKKYLGVYTDNTQADSTRYQDYSWSLIKGTDGQDGSDGRGISSTQIRYASSDNGQTAPSSGWNPTIPNVSQGNYLWTRTVITYTDTTTSTSYSVAYVGTDGDDGKSVYVTSAIKNNGVTTVVLTDSDGQTTTLTINDGEDGSSGTPGANGYVHTAWANSANGATDFSTTVSTNKKYLGVYTDNTQADSTRYQDYSWSLIKGADGDPGDPGLNAATVFLYKRPAMTTGTATGALVTLTDHAANQMLEELVVDVEPVQSGTGTPTPTNVRDIVGYQKVITSVTGKNMLDPTTYVSQAESSGITSTPDGNGGVAFTGTATATKVRVFADFRIHQFHLKKGVTYYCASNNNSGLTPSNNTFAMVVREVDSSTTLWGEVDGGYTPTKDVNIYVGIRYVSGFAFPANFKVYPVLTTSQDTSYEPFSGNDAIEYAVSESYAPAYHATLNLTSGQFLFTSKSVTLNGSDSENWAYNSTYKGFYIASPSAVLDRYLSGGLLLCNMATVSTRSGWANIPTPWGIYLDSQLCFRVDTSVTGTTVASFKAWLAEHPLQLVYEMSSYIAQQRNRREIPVVDDAAYIWSDAGNVSVQYNKYSSGSISMPSGALTYTFADGSLSPASSLNGWSTTIPDTNGSPCYVIQATAIATSSTTSIATNKWSSPVILSQDGINGVSGANGASVNTITNYYLATSASTGITKESEGWTDTVQNVTSTNKYLWNYEHVTYTEGKSSTDTDPVIIGVYGDTGAAGAAGRGVTQLTDYYKLHTTDQTAPATPDNGGTGWVTTCPEWESGKFIWTCVKIDWDKAPTPTYTTPTLAQALNDVAQKAYENEQALTNFLTTYSGDKASLQSQIDGKIETYFQMADPSTNWTNAQRAAHEGDLWYNTLTNVNSRWDGSAWVELEVDVPASVYDTIDRKAQIFTSQPVAPYHVGDLWFNSADSEILTCLAEREKVDSFTITSVATTQSFSYSHTWTLEAGQTYRVIGTGNVTTQASGGTIKIDNVITYTGDLSTSHISIPFTEVHTYGSTNAVSYIEMTESGILITYAVSGSAERTIALSLSFIDTYKEADWVKYNKYTDDSLANALQERLNNEYSTTYEVNVAINNEVGSLNSSISERMGNIETAMSEIKQTADNVSIRVEGMFDQSTDELIVDHVKTSTGYTFDSNGLTIRKSNEEIENSLTNLGMYVKRWSGDTAENVLVADANGVNALNLTTRNYIIIGQNSRIQDYSDGVDDKRTACYYIGG